MLRRALSVLLVLASAAAAAADTKITLTYYSDPPGAMIYEGGQQFGYAPLNLEYKAPGRFRECLTLNPLKFRWMSGVEVDVKDLQACPAGGKKKQFTVFRPNGLPGADIDAQFAIMLLQQRSAGEAARLAQQQANWNASLVTLQQQLQRPKTCTSTVIGSQVFTNCY